VGELVFIGLGLYDEKDITLKGLEAARGCDVLFAEAYTSRLAGANQETVASLIGKAVRLLSREEVEAATTILEAAKRERVGFLVPGDPMTATTHVDLRLRAAEAGVPTRVVHGTSILTAAAGLLGLQAYKFGRTTTVPFPAKGYRPGSPYDVVARNRDAGLHTLVLLDLKEDGTHLTAREGMAYLRRLEEERGEGVFPPDLLVAVVGAAGSSSPVVRADRVDRLLREDFGGPLHVVVVPGRLHFLEAEALVRFAGAPPGVLPSNSRP
jgi:diphthine synthase